MSDAARMMFYVCKAIGPPPTLYRGFDANRAPAIRTSTRTVTLHMGEYTEYPHPAELWWEWFNAAEACR